LTCDYDNTVETGIVLSGNARGRPAINPHDLYCQKLLGLYRALPSQRDAWT